MKSVNILPLLEIMQKLRDPIEGCAWDRKQTLTTLVPHTIEEAYEVADAIEQKDFIELKAELGDLLFQVVFYSQIASEEKLFDFEDVIKTLSDKLTRRHPHVFSQKHFDNDDEVNANWEAQKAIERANKAKLEKKNDSILDNIPNVLPALIRSNKIQKRCSSVGFDWDKLEPVVDKIKEELDEVLVEVNRDDLTMEQKNDRICDELGDLLFANVNLVRHLNHDPEHVLRQANNKFENRFRKVEILVKKEGKKMKDCSLEELDKIWDLVKKEEQLKSNDL